ncbi:hypothetical protein [Paenibacillus xanthanilyticus]|uniref:Uncharacterized protein n=1 Tax=Paenibacillus xanthanilyticus TaxID=1783531 RepID=A0ABV8K1F8_9BACL
MYTIRHFCASLFSQLHCCTFAPSAVDAFATSTTLPLLSKSRSAG